ncbi:MAG: hypothetical protein IJ679_05785 [Lachnospiraceae bacterium]|nr:hypothetical protein [Lachnospiraceae bacterium]
MTINTLDKAYQVIGYAKSDSAVLRYICREKSDGRLYEVLRIIERQRVDELMPFFLAHEEHGKFSDYHGLFVQNESLHLVFSYHEGQTLQEKLEKQGCLLEERLALFSAILEKLMLLAMPAGIAADVLAADQILASDAGQIEFRYHLMDLDTVAKNDRQDMQKSLLLVYDFLFFDEIKRKTVLPILDYRDILLPGDYEEILDIYRLFKIFCQIIEELPEEEKERPKTRAYLIWERIKKAFPIVRRIFLFSIVIIALCYLLWTVRDTSKDKTKKDIVFHQIGTYDLDDILKEQ